MTVEARESNASITYVIGDIKVGAEFEIPFKFLADDECVKVFVRKNDDSRQDLVPDTDYAIKTSEGTAGVWGTVIIKTEYVSLKKLCIYRAVPISQEKQFDSQTVFAGTTEDALDKLTILMQDNQFKNSTIHAPEDDSLTSDSLTLPAAAARAGKYLFFDDQGNAAVGKSEQQTKSLRQSEGELPDPTFELSSDKRKGKFISFDEKGSVVLSPKYTSDYGIEILSNNAIKIKSARTGEYDHCFGGVVIKSIPGNLIHNDNGYISVVIPPASASGDGLMSAADKRDVNSAMKFPSVESGSVLPQASERASKVIGFGADGRTIEMMEASDANITVGEGIQKNGEEISLRPTSGGKLGGIYQNYRPENDLLIIEPDGQAYAVLPKATNDILGGIKVGSGLDVDNTGTVSVTTETFQDEPIFVGNVRKQFGFKAVNKMNINSVTAVGSFLLNGRLTFFCGEYRGKIWYSHDCKHWYQSSLSSSLSGIVPTSFCKIRYNGLEIICTACAEGGDIAYSQDFGKYFKHEKAGVSPSNKIVAITDVAFSLCNGVIEAGNHEGFTRYDLPGLGNIKDCVEFNGYYYFICEINGTYKIQRGMYAGGMFQPEWLEVYSISGAVIKSIVNDGTRLLIVVNKLSNSSDVMQSTDGIRWTKLSTVNYLVQNLSGENGKYMLFAAENTFYVPDNTFTNLRSVYTPLRNPHYDAETGLFACMDFYAQDFCVSVTAYAIGG